MSAHGALGHGQGGSAAGKTQILSYGLKRTKGIERQPTAVDSATVGNDLDLST